MSSVLGTRVADYVYVDFASGAGGPTPYIEQHLNQTLRDEGRKEDVKFVLTDIKPHVAAWDAVAKKSDNVSYVAQSIDATDVPTADVLLKGVPDVKGKKVMRLFSLAFHHFDDDLASKVLENTIETSDGFWYVQYLGLPLPVDTPDGTLSLQANQAQPVNQLTNLSFLYLVSSNCNLAISPPSSPSACCGRSPC